MPVPPESLAGSQVIAFVLADLAIILIAARIVGGLFARFKQPRIVGELIAGILIGPTVLGGHLAKGAVTSLDLPAIDGQGLVNDLYPLQSFSFLNLIGLLTLVFFMFLVGLEVQQKLLKGKERNILMVAGAATIAPLILGFTLGAILDSPGRWMPESGVSYTTHSLFLSAGLAVTAFPVMARILQEKRLLDTPMGAVGVGSAAVVTPLMFLIVAAGVTSAKGQGVPGAVGTKALLAIGFVAVLFIVVRPLLRLILDRLWKPGQPLRGEVFAILLIGALAAGLAADRIGIHSLNGGFLFGACVPQLAGLARAVTDRMLEFVVVFMIPVFLTVSGLQTDLRVLEPALIPGIVLFVAAMVVAKLGAATLAGRAVGLDWRQSGAIGALMNCRGLMILVVALIAVQAGAMTPELQATFVIGAIVTTLMTGPLVEALLPKRLGEAGTERAVTNATGEVPAMTGGPRVLIAPGGPESIEKTMAGAARFTEADGPAAQFLLVALPPLAELGEYVGAGSEDEAGASERAMRWLEPASAGMRAAGADASTAVLQSATPRQDLARIAQSWAATDAIVGPSLEGLELSGVAVQALA